MKYKKSFILLVLISATLFQSCVNRKANSELSKSNLNIVINEITKVNVFFEARNGYITKVYDDLRAGNANKDTNIVRLNKIKNLSTDIHNQTERSLYALRSKLKENDTVQIFVIGIRYLKTVREIEPMLPVLYRKMNDDIMEKGTTKNDTLIKAGQKINAATRLYNGLKDLYSKKNGVITDEAGS